ncbi:MAG: rubredoxin [Desulfamplus sp.]|nr:rubredoxin [Desulfamplus sp.]
MKKWKCTICRYIHEGDAPPDRCPICKAPASKFILLEPELDEKSQNALKIKELERQIEERKAVIEAGRPRLFKLYKALQEQMVKHHAHPISVHFPNGVLPVAVTLFILAFVFEITALTGIGASNEALSSDVISKTLSNAGFLNMLFVLFVLPFVIFAGYVEWIKKYNRATTSLFVIKIAAASITTVTCIFNVIWYMADPNVLSSNLSLIFIISNIIMLASAGVAGHLGGKLVFKD